MSLTLTRIFFFTSSIIHGLCIFFLSSGSVHYYFHLLDRKSYDSPASFPPIPLSLSTQIMFKCIILSHLFCSLEVNSILSPRQTGFILISLILTKFFIFLSPFAMGLTNLSRALKLPLLLSIFPKLSTMSLLES